MEFLSNRFYKSSAIQNWNERAEEYKKLLKEMEPLQISSETPQEALLMCKMYRYLFLYTDVYAFAEKSTYYFHLYFNFDYFDESEVIAHIFMAYSACNYQEVYSLAKKMMTNKRMEKHAINWLKDDALCADGFTTYEECMNYKKRYIEICREKLESAQQEYDIFEKIHNRSGS